MRSRASLERFWSASDVQPENRTSRFVLNSKMSDKTRLARYFYLRFFLTDAKCLKTFGRSCRDALSLAKTVNFDWWELGKVQTFGAFLHSASGSDRKSVSWWNVLELNPSTSAWRGDEKRGACQVILEASCLDMVRLSRQEKEGVTLSKTLAPAEEELRAFTVRFCPLWTCDCIFFFQRQTAYLGCRNAVGEMYRIFMPWLYYWHIVIVSFSTINVFVCASEGVSDFYYIIHS